jgi:hypothetical protein
MYNHLCTYMHRYIYIYTNYPLRLTLGAWGKTLRVAVSSRMACLKAVDQVYS